MDDARLPSPEELIPRLRKLWPHRTHESNWLQDIACGLGWHRWYPMILHDQKSGLRVACTFCRFCTEVKVDDVRRVPPETLPPSPLQCDML